ncbi:hypothetical protein BH09MYX1_BH09MYX1_19490 [soil metagenome]
MASMGRAVLLGWSLAAMALLAPAAACVVRDRTCASATECGQRFGNGQSCVAGRCIEDHVDGGPKRQLAIMAANSRRLVAHPTDIAYLRSGGDPASVPPAIVLGKDDARLLLKFEVAIGPEDDVVEAYLLLDRLDVMDTDPSPISLHVERIIDRWDTRSITWARQPRMEDDRGPATLLSVGARPLVRLDVTAFVKRWKRRDPSDQGLAVVAGSTNATGIAFAAVDSAGSETDTSDPSKPLWIPSAPRLELYLQRPVNASPAASSNASAVGSAPTPSASSSIRAAPSPR